MEDSRDSLHGVEEEAGVDAFLLEDVEQSVDVTKLCAPGLAEFFNELLLDLFIGVSGLSGEDDALILGDVLLHGGRVHLRLVHLEPLDLLLVGELGDGLLESHEVVEEL